MKTTGKTQCLGTGARNGFSLIEVLVALFVLALGVIGAAGMQLVAIRTAQQSGFESAALRLATEMADTIRMYERQAASDDSGNPYLALAYSATAEPVPERPGKLCRAEACNPEDLAKFEIYKWEKRIGQSLPGGRAVICRDANPWNSHSGSLKWECDAGNAGYVPIIIKLGWQSREVNPDAIESFAPALAIAVTTPVAPIP